MYIEREEEERMYEIDSNKRKNADLLADKERLERYQYMNMCLSIYMSLFVHINL
jgi:hypothetical protein